MLKSAKDGVHAPHIVVHLDEQAVQNYVKKQERLVQHLLPGLAL